MTSRILRPTRPCCAAARMRKARAIRRKIARGPLTPFQRDVARVDAFIAFTRKMGRRP